MSDEVLFEADRVKACKEALRSFQSEFSMFLHVETRPSMWVFGDDIISVHLFRETRLIQDAPISCLTIGTITVAREFRCRGLGMDVIRHIHNNNPRRCTYVDTVMNDDLLARLLKYGWRKVDDEKRLPDLFKMTPLKQK